MSILGWHFFGFSEDLIGKLESLPIKEQQELWKDMIVILDEEIQKEINKEVIAEITKNALEPEKDSLEELLKHRKPVDRDRTQQLQDDFDYWEERVRKNNIP